MERTLSSILTAIEVKSICGPQEAVITDLVCDSRRAVDGCMFVAVRGVAVDAHKFIPQVVSQGHAAAVVCEELPQELAQGVAYVVVPDSSIALAHLASEWFDRPSEHLKLVGVTGTNGKTTTATLLYEMAQMLGHKAGLISTVKNIVDHEEIAAVQTTPDHLSLNRLLAKMVDAGCEYAFMEVSSHAVAQRRISGLRFAGGIFTNLTRDHLDYHKTVENYLRAKKAFFDQLPKSAFSVTNLDDKNGLVMTQNTRSRVYTYSLRSLSDFKGRIIESHFEGMLLDVNGREVAVHFIGKYNASNLLAVYGAAVALGKDPDEVLRIISTLHSVSGRLETIHSERGFTAIVDYAHTPDALVNVLNAIHGVLEGRGRVITVVGAGGNRDKGKRPIMAREAARLSDQLIITSDNPRFEEPQDIVNDMLAGLTPDDALKTLSIVDRREAIRAACAMARQGDVILVAGKGHEDYQEVRGVKHHFDDREELKKIMQII